MLLSRHPAYLTACFLSVGLAPIAARAQTPAATPIPAPSAVSAPLDVKVQTATRDFALGQSVHTKIEVRNRGKEWLTLRQVTLGDGQLVSDLSGKNIGPGKTVSWTGDVTPQMLTTEELGPAQIRVQVETEAGSVETKLPLARIEPFKVELRYDPRPVAGGAESRDGDLRAFSVVVTSRKPGTDDATVTLRLPDGWKLTEGKNPDTRTLRRSGDTRRIGYKVLVPLAAPLGEYPIEATVTVGGRTYTARATVAVTR